MPVGDNALSEAVGRVSCNLSSQLILLRFWVLERTNEQTIGPPIGDRSEGIYRDI